MPSPTAKTLNLLRQSGYTADVAERSIPGANIRRDLFGFADIVAVRQAARVILAVQATTADHVSARLAKTRTRPELAAWLRAGGAFEVWGWTRRRGRWHVRRVSVRPEDLGAVVMQTPPRGRRTKGARQRELFADGSETALPPQDAADER